MLLAIACICSGTVKGVDSTATASEALEAGRQLALRQGCIVAISGAEDLVRGGGGLAGGAYAGTWVALDVLWW